MLHLNLEKSPAFQALAQELKTWKNTLLVENISWSETALICDFIQKKTSRPLIFITGAFKEEQIFSDFSVFQKAVLEMPSADIPLDAKTEIFSLDLMGQRALSLNAIAKKKPPLILAPLSAILQKFSSLKTLEENICLLKKGQHITFDFLTKKLAKLGYKQTAVVSDKGEFAVRGGIIDLFSPACESPCRLEFFADTLEEIRLFDPASQKSIEKILKITISPAAAEVWGQDKKFSLIDFLENASIAFDDFSALETNYLTLEKILFKGSKKYNADFFTLKEFLQKTRTRKNIFFLNHFLKNLSWEKPKISKNRFFLFSECEIFQQKKQVCKWISPFQDLPTDNLEKIKGQQNLKELLKNKIKAILLTENKTEEQKLKDLLQRDLLQKDLLAQKEKLLSFKTGYLSTPIFLGELKLALLPYSFFTSKKPLRRRKQRSFAYHTPLSEFHQLKIGEKVVHFHSGIGKYLGIEKHSDYLGEKSEFIVLEYAGSSKLYVPISQAYLVSKYIGSHEESPSLSALSSNKWHKAKLSAQTKIIGYASDLLALYARRLLNKGFCLKEDSIETKLFELEFPYTETVDQKMAIQEIKQDLKQKKPMERLLSGDVGYGKTEVAMRAAFKMAFEGKKQVALLVPTTILALQHFETFQERFSGYPINIVVLSRFNSASQNSQIIEKIKTGAADIVVGTHRLLSKDIQFKDLGLLIIDEEHRFGVRAKEKLKKFKHNVDVLSMSATPIPRTLYMSLIGIRNISQINTPPQDRVPIKTILAETSKELLQNALLKELAREGQAFVLHNRTDTIFQRKDFYQKLLPHAKILAVHGQMKPEEIENIFHTFKQKKADILITTTIIENGIDIPNANTIIIENASSFGLADLYQLRGRVGRWDRTAYAYLLTPKGKKLLPLAKKRLLSLSESPGFGGGSKIAMRDLEIRGAGDLLGTKQAGQVSQIGFHLYCKLLKKAVEALKTKKVCSFVEPKLEFPYSAYLPESYIKETSLRMEIYHRLGEALNFEEIDQIAQELIDRFGPLPDKVLFLLALSRIKIKAALYLLTLIKFGEYSITIEQLKGKKTIRKTFAFPKEARKTARDLEEFTLKLIYKNYPPE